MLAARSLPMSKRRDTPARPRIRVAHPHHPETSAVGEGFDPSLSVMAARPPIYPVSTYCFGSAQAMKHFFAVALGTEELEPGSTPELIYARLNNPNAEMFEEALVALEKGGAVAAASFASGMSAIATTLLTLLRPGDVVLHTLPVYGGTDHVLHHLLTPFGIGGRGVRAGDHAQLAAVAREIGERLAMIYVETPANPTLRMTDIAAAARLAAEMRQRHGRAVPLVVDNTFLGPVFQSPLAHGADLVIYSATKYIGGHSDVVAGALVGRDAGLVGRIKGTRAFLGTICEPFSAWLLQRSLATIYTRMVKQSKNAAKIVERLRRHPKIERVHYPALFEGEQAEIFHRQCSAPGGMISIEIAGGEPAAFRFLDALRIAKLAVSLGGVETLATHPKSTVSSEMSAEEQEEAGITDGLVRISIGVEYWRDLLADLEQALDKA